MATVCVLGHPAPGHVNPNLPLMAELCRRGERVVYFATEPFRAKVERTGAEFRSYSDHALFERNLGAGGMLGGMAGLMETTERILPALLEEFRAARPDYLLVEAHAVWGNLLAQIEGLPTATLCSMFAMNESLISAGRPHGSPRMAPHRANWRSKGCSRSVNISNLRAVYGGISAPSARAS